MTTRITTAVVPVAGLGTRLLPITRAIPKELLPLARKPILQYVAEELLGFGIKKIVLVTSEAKRSIDGLFRPDRPTPRPILDDDREARRQCLWSQQSHDVEIEVVVQPRQLGLGHAIFCAEPAVGLEPFAVSLADSVIVSQGPSCLLRQMESVFFERAAHIVMAFEEVEPRLVSHFGIADPKSDADVFELDDIVEKPEIGQAPSNLAVAARYVFTNDIFEHLRQTGLGTRGEIQLTDAIRRSIQVGRRVLGVKLTDSQRRYDIGSIPSYVQAFVHFALQDSELREAVLAALASHRADHQHE